MSKAKKFFSFLLFFSLLFFFSFNYSTGFLKTVQASPLDLEEQKGFESGQIPDEFGSGGTPKDIREIAIDVVKIFLSFLAIIFLVLVIWGGFEWMTAGGNEERLSKAKDRIKNGVIGLIIILAAYAITEFVIEELIEASTDTYDSW